MNKLAVVLGVAAVATLAGCKDPSYRYASGDSQNEVKDAEAKEIGTVEEPVQQKCNCPPGTKHTEPCGCGAADCQCIVETKPVVKPAKPAKPAEPEYTVYIVQNGDYLAKISKKFNVTISSIKRINNLKKDVIRVGQKLKIPGKVDVGVQAAPAPAAKASAAKASKKSYEPYKGATKEYVVKAGDTLGAIAYGNGCNIRQLKELNALTKDTLKVGQKLKVPADGKAVAQKAEAKAAAPAPAKKEAAAPAAKPAETAAPAAAEPAPAAAPAPAAEAAAPAAAQAAETPAQENPTYVVQEGEDLMAVAIRWNVSSAAIRELNNLSDDAQIKPGQVLKLPADAQQ